MNIFETFIIVFLCIIAIAKTSHGGSGGSSRGTPSNRGNGGGWDTNTPGPVQNYPQTTGWTENTRSTWSSNTGSTWSTNTGSSNTMNTDTYNDNDSNYGGTSNTNNHNKGDDEDTGGNGKKGCWGKKRKKRKRKKKKGNGKGDDEDNGDTGDYDEDDEDCDDDGPWLSSTWDLSSTDYDDNDTTTTDDDMDDTTTTDDSDDMDDTTTSNPVDEIVNCPYDDDSFGEFTPCRCYVDNMAEGCPQSRCQRDGNNDCQTSSAQIADQQKAGGFLSGTTDGTTMGLYGGVIGGAVLILCCCLIIGAFMYFKRKKKYEGMDNIAEIDDVEEGVIEGIDGRVETAITAPTGFDGEDSEIGHETGKTQTIIKYESSDDDEEDIVCVLPDNETETGGNGAVLDALINDGNDNYTK